jgi:predicted dehydrogenase
MTTNRRSFIRNSVAATAGMGIVSSFPGGLQAAQKLIAPSDQINIGLIGCRSMGFEDFENQLNIPGVNCIGLCDIDQNVLNDKGAEILKTYNQKPKLYGDYRKLLENKDLHAVVIGTPDHWHCLTMVNACETGLDVYVEKPMANSIEECNLMVNAANRYNRVVQVGQQQRSGAHWNKINQMIKSDRIGKLRKTNIWGNFNYGIGQPIVANSPVPKGVDFDMWLGPAPIRTFNSTRFHGSWRMFWDYGGGLVTDWGVHLIDMALWAKDITSPPKKILATGSNISFKDYNHETYDTMSVIFEMDDYQVTWQHTAGIQNGPWNMPYGLEFIGDLGTIVADRSGYKIIPQWNSKEKKSKTDAEESDKGGENHQEHARNFIDCVKSRQKPVCTPEIGRTVAIAAHCANIAVRSGENLLLWDESKGKFSNSEKANQYIVPEYRKPWALPKV